ncbi:MULTISPECIES: hypothetical protein [Vibrio]|uniref:hypothetical protein n=1 Tax=Vibrio TaxID=662 RepID=UPI000841D125|nr:MULTISPECIES: hypothetical protein [Vibrio]ODM56874.1 hypothetical protein BC455_18615 [Vibrio harveyi]USD58485.1 hypothetical protein J4N44_27720 [Vibrio sp. SCSIO 43155]
MNFKHFLAIWFVVVSLPSQANEFVSQKISDYVHGNTHVQSTPVENRFVDKYFNCDFYLVTTSKAMGRSPEVAFYPDLVAILPNGNVLTASLPKNNSRLHELEKCLSKEYGLTTKASFHEVNMALEALYPQMKGPNDKAWFTVNEGGVTLINASYYRGKNSFFIKMQNGHPSEIHAKFETGY